jgi:hypothetical protein
MVILVVYFHQEDLMVVMEVVGWPVRRWLFLLCASGLLLRCTCLSSFSPPYLLIFGGTNDHRLSPVGVAFLGKDDIVTCGTTGVDKWSAKGNKWTNLSAQSFHAVQTDKYSKILYLCGSKGSIAKLISN